jgi:hypothetical protein
MGIPWNEIADKEAKAALEIVFLTTEKYPPQDLISWIKTEDKKTRKVEKKEFDWNKDKKKINRRDQVVIFKLRTGYNMANHGYIINKQDNNECNSFL